MPSAKSARASIRKRSRNVPLRTKARTQVRNARRLIEENNLEAAEQAVLEATVSLDKAAQKGAIHANNAARRKSRIMLQLHRAKNS